MSLNIFPQTLCSGDVIPLKLAFVQPGTETPYNMTGSTIGVTVKPLPEDTPIGETVDTEAEFKQDLPGDTTGVFNFLIGPLTVGDHWLDIKMWQTVGGVNSNRTTIVAPVQMHIVQSVTTR